MLTIWTGLTIGALWALVASTYNLILASTGILNFAQGALVMFGGIMAFNASSTWGLPFGLGMVFGVVVGFGMGLLSERLSVWPVRWALKGRQSSHVELITTVGFATGLAGVVEVVWGTNPLNVGAPGQNVYLTIFGGRIQPWAIVLIGLSVVVAVGLHLWMTRTRTGLACLAMSEDRDAATARGVNASRLSVGSFMAAGALAGLVGTVMAPSTFAYPSLATTLALSGFVAVAIGGLGEQIGCLLAGLGIGLIDAFSTRYLGASWAEVLVFVVLVLTLLLRPGGIGGRVAVRRV